MNLQAQRHPIQNLLDDVDHIVIGIPVPVSDARAEIRPVELDGELKAHLRDMLMSAYATGVTGEAKNA